MTPNPPTTPNDGPPTDGLHIAGINGDFSDHVQSDTPRCPDCQILYADGKDRGLCASCQRAYEDAEHKSQRLQELRRPED
jgi:ribosomal protein S27AE